MSCRARRAKNGWEKKKARPSTSQQVYSSLLSSALFSLGRAFPCISLAVITVAVYCGVGYVLPALFGGVGDGMTVVKGGVRGRHPHLDNSHSHNSHRPLALSLSTAAAALTSFNMYLHFAGVARAKADPLGAGVRVHPRGAVPQGAYEGHTRCGPCGGAHKPPGTHHCAACGVCSRWHDHHCFFTGTCLSSAPGGSVAPHFLLMCGWILAGSVYALVAVCALLARRRAAVAVLVREAVMAAAGEVGHALPPPQGLVARGVAAVVGVVVRSRPPLLPPFPLLLAPTATAIRALSQAARGLEGKGVAGRTAAAVARLGAAALAVPAAALSPATPPWFLASVTLAGIAGAALAGVSLLLAQVLDRMRTGASLADAGRPRLVLVGGGEERDLQPPPSPPSLHAALERVFGPGPAVRWLLPPYGDRVAVAEG